jgi:two-component system, cell cycle response regulator DivK
MSGSTILYIEDNVDNRTLIRRILSAEGYTVKEAWDAGEALELLNSLHPDLILMDINMPKVDGYIQKPIDIDLLPQQIERYLRKK